MLTIIAPHEPTEGRVRALLALFPGASIRYSKIDDWKGESVIVVDSIGKLFGLYRFADIAMIGGGFGAGLHNIWKRLFGAFQPSLGRSIKNPVRYSN